MSVWPALVTQEEFAEFVRSEQYFRDDLWQAKALPRSAGGDEVLRRVFDWKRRGTPVTGVSWWEADAFTNWQGGRLPFFDELPPTEIPEWRADNYNRRKPGRGVLPDENGCRWVVGWHGGERAHPDFTGGRFGFRVMPKGGVACLL